MATLTLPITTTYVPDWGVAHIVRELLQNGLDAEKEGFALSVDATDGGKLKITNEGVTLDRSTLCLGGTSKAGGGFAGKFGEGYKLAVLCALRLNIDVRVRTADESWQFFLARDSDFGGALVIKVKITTAPTYVRRVTFQLDAGSDMDLKHKLLAAMEAVRLPKNARKLETSTGSLLLDGQHAGCVYAHGLFVTKLSATDKAMFGYDLSGLELNRDRSIPDMYSLRNEIGMVLAELATNNRLPSLDVVVRDTFEQSAVSQLRYSWSDMAKNGLKAMANAYCKGKALAKDIDDAALAAAVGVDAILAPSALTDAFAPYVPSVQKAAETAGKSLDTAELYTTSNEETFAQYPALARIFRAVEVAGIKVPEVRVGRFMRDNILGTYTITNDTVALKREIVGAEVTPELIDTVIHELAHRTVDAHNLTHAQEMNRLFGMVCAALLRA